MHNLCVSSKEHTRLFSVSDPSDAGFGVEAAAQSVCHGRQKTLEGRVGYAWTRLRR